MHYWCLTHTTYLQTIYRQELTTDRNTAVEWPPLTSVKSASSRNTDSCKKIRTTRQQTKPNNKS